MPQAVVRKSYASRAAEQRTRHRLCIHPLPMPTKRVLVVEDDQWLRPLLGACLSDEGYEVVEADSGTAALQQVHDQHPDLVVLDVNLPQLSGLSVLEKLVYEEPTSNLPVILMSGSVDLTETQQAKLADAALSKPLDIEELMAHIDRSLEQRETEHCPGCQCQSRT
jgi:CheY-like chemotaxis protein